MRIIITNKDSSVTLVGSANELKEFYGTAEFKNDIRKERIIDKSVMKTINEILENYTQNDPPNDYE